MKKNEEIPRYKQILEKNVLYYIETFSENLESVFIKNKVIESMKEYAENYAKECLIIAAEKACANFECIDIVVGVENIYPYVEKNSILNIQLPEHTFN